MITKIRYRNETAGETIYTVLQSAVPFNPQPYELTGLISGNEYSVSMRARNGEGYAREWSPDSTLDLSTPVVDNPPIINSFIADPTSITVNETTDLTVQAEDNENDAISFSYSIVSIDGTDTTSTDASVVGSFTRIRTEVTAGITFGFATWDPPTTAGSYRIRVTATADGLTTVRDIFVGVTAIVVNPPSRPSAPVLSFLSSTSLRISWRAPSNNGGAPIDEYEVRYRAFGTSTYTTLTFDSSPLPTQTDITTGINSNNQYESQVRAYE